MASKPDGSGSYIRELHLDPGGSRLGLVKITWGRLVDVHDLDTLGEVESDPIFRDMVVRQELESDGVDYLLEVDPITEITRLIVLRDADLGDPQAFTDLVVAAAQGLPEVDAKADDGSGVQPFSMVPSNAAMVLCFDDLLMDDAASAVQLSQLVRVRTGYTPTQPFGARVFFERNFGAVSGGSFHSSRIVIDPAISDLEAQNDATLTPNAFGLPASLVLSGDASFSIRIPTRTDISVGQFDVLTNLRGRPLGTTANGPVDFSDSREPLMRGLRAGNEFDPDRGFLMDDVAPQLLGVFDVVVDAAVVDPVGGSQDFLLDVTFPTACQPAPMRGDLLEVAGAPLQVRADASSPDAQGRVLGLAVRSLIEVNATGNLLGFTSYVTNFRDELGLEDGCWARFLPTPGSGTSVDVAPNAVASLRFSEAIDPRRVRALDGPTIVRAEDDPNATSIAPSLARLDAGLRNLQMVPLVPLPHVAGVSEPWRILLTESDQGLVDLAGNSLAAAPDAIRFSLDPNAAASDTGGVVLRFNATDEYSEFDQTPGASDLRGQISFDLERGVAIPRPVQRQSWPVDQSQLLPSLMLPLPVAVPEPLVPLGSKLQTLWRYADVGWLVNDESRYDLDVEGLSWVPFTGGVVSDFFEGFEMRLGHSSRLPDESLSMGALLYAASGLLFQGLFDDNLVPGLSGLSEIVSPSATGYFVDPADIYTASSGTRMAPYPMNRQGGTKATFTWRDTSVLSLGGAQGSGIPMQVETDLGLYPGIPPGSIAPAGMVPSIGLPLLMQFGAKPDPTALGLNGAQVAVARSGQLFPTWRVDSSGGFNTQGNAVSVDPDLSLSPNGGFNPNSTPPGNKTRPNNPVLYYGELQTVVRYSRVHSVWFDGGSVDPDWNEPVIFPSPSDQAGASRVIIQFRGATSFINTAGAEVDATRLNAYGDVDSGQAFFANNDPTWKDTVGELDGARFVQVRLTFENDIDAGVSPFLDALILSFER